MLLPPDPAQGGSRHGQRRAIVAEGAGGLLIGREVQLKAGVERQPEVRPAAAAVHQHPYADRLTAGPAPRLDPLADAAARRQHVVHDERALAGTDLEASLEGAAPGRLLGEDATQTQEGRHPIAEAYASRRR